MADGSRHALRLVPEVTYGVTPATPTFEAIRHTGTTVALAKESLQSGELRDDRMIASYRHGARQVGGDITVEVSFGSFDTILEALLGGTWDTDTPTAGTDQLKAGVLRRSFTLERYFADILAANKPWHRFTGCEFNTMELQVNANALITGTFGVVGKDQVLAALAIAGATYPAAPATEPLDSFTGALKEGGVDIAVVTELTLSLDNGLDPKYVVGSKTTNRPSISRSNVTGTMTAYFEDSTLLEKFINETESSLEFTLPDGAGNSYRFVIPKLKYTGGQPDVTSEGPITLAMPFQAILDSVSGTNIIIERESA